jgi:hypothetical protein
MKKDANEKYKNALLFYRHAGMVKSPVDNQPQRT